MKSWLSSSDESRGAAQRARIFISYRREDSRGDTGRLYDRLMEQFGDHQIFRDIDAIAPGEPWLEVLRQTLESCNVVLAIIGPKWLSVRRGNRRRLDIKEDLVRQEIATALGRDLPVVPVLVGNAAMPRAKDLPDDLTRLASCQAVVLHELHFHRDLDTLIARIESLAAEVRRRHLIPAKPDPQRPWAYRDPDWFAESPPPVGPPLEVQCPKETLPLLREPEENVLQEAMVQRIDHMLQRVWKAEGVILPGVCMSLATGESGEYTIRILGCVAGRGTNWDEMDEPIQTLEARVREELCKIIGHQEIANLVAIRSPAYWNEIVLNSEMLTDLVLVSRALLVERVRLIPFAAIVEAFLRLRTERRSLVQIVEEIRCLDEVRPLLPGNDKRHSYVSLSSKLERAISRSVDYQAGQPVLAMESELGKNLLGSAAAALEGLSGCIAVRVTNHAIRPFVRKILGLEFPGLWVLAQRELLPNLTGKVISTIDLN